MDRRSSQPSLFRIGNSSPIESVLRHGFPYSRKLRSHSSCVNALAFSSGKGQYLASGGDDKCIKIWDFHQEDVISPMGEFLGPIGNIFTLAFSAKNRYLYAGGVCETVFRYDPRMISSPPQARYTKQEGAIRALSCHPSNEEICLSASEDGTVCRYDARAPNTAEGSLHMLSEATGVQYHPRMQHLFVTGSGQGDVCLRDERMAFSSNETGGGVVLTFTTKLTKRSVKHSSNPEISSISFDREGEKFSVTFLHYLPTIYSTLDPNPVATCSAPLSYSNSCTMKHGNFGALGMDSDVFYGAGSDDFRGYVWRIPCISQLLEQRKEISPESWFADEADSNTIAFTEGFSAAKHVPTDLSTPFCRLNGHRSIVNTALFHPQFLHIVTAGIENNIILHSPTCGSPCTHDLCETPTEVRTISADDEEDGRLFFRSLASLSSEDDRDEERNIRLFDHIRRTEGQADVFQSRRWSASEDSDDDANSEADMSVLKETQMEC